MPRDGTITLTNDLAGIACVASALFQSLSVVGFRKPPQPPIPALV